MKKVMIFFAASLFVAKMNVNAQVREGQITINKKKQNAMMIEVNAPSKEVEKAWAESFARNNMKSKVSRGVYSYQDVIMPGWGTNMYDVYTRVEPLGRDRSILYISAADPNGVYVTVDGDSALTNKMADYLYDFVSTQSYSSPDLDIRNYTDSVRMDEAAEKKYATDRKNLEDQRSKLETQLSEMDRRYQQDRASWQTRKQRLDEMRRNRETAQNSSRDPQ